MRISVTVIVTVIATILAIMAVITDVMAAAIAFIVIMAAVVATIIGASVNVTLDQDPIQVVVVAAVGVDSRKRQYTVIISLAADIWSMRLEMDMKRTHPVM